MSKPDFTDIDAAIIECVKAKNPPLYHYSVRDPAEDIAKLTEREACRVIDGRLQALRRAGKIVADRRVYGGWRIA